MDKEIYLSALYDYYKELLTMKQREYFEDYYFEDLTMEEIAINNSISKNAVSKSLIEVKEKLEHFEVCLHLYQNKKNILNILDEDTIKKIEDYI